MSDEAPAGLIATNKCSGVKPSHLNIGYPQAEFCPLHPPSYGCGFSSDGRIIGSNLQVPYPRKFPWYHDIPFRRSVDWYTPQVVGDKEYKIWEYLRQKEEKRPGGHVDGCGHCRLEDTTAQTKMGGKKLSGCDRQKSSKDVQGGAENKAQDGEGADNTYSDETQPIEYIVKDDPAYKAWVDGKLATQREREKKHEEMKKVPWEIKLYPGHFAPPILQTTNETYGQHLDMLPKRPLVYPEVEINYKPIPLLVRYRRSNISDHPLIPDHTFALDKKEMESLDGKPLGGIIGAPYRPSDDAHVESAKKDVENPSAKQKVPTCTSGCRGMTRAMGPGVQSSAPGFPVYDPWSFRRSAVMLGQVIGERQDGCTWPVYTPTGMELNRPIPRFAKMTSGHPYSAQDPEEIKVPVDSKGGVYRSGFENLTKRTWRLQCTPMDPNYLGYSKRHPCHRNYVNPEYLPTPASARPVFQCDPASNPVSCEKRGSGST